MKKIFIIFIILLNINLIFSKSILLIPDKIDASSYLLESTKNIYHHYKIYDQNVKTTYSESLLNEGIGNNLTFYFNDIVLIESFEIINGFNESKNMYKWNNRIKKLNIKSYYNDFLLYSEEYDIKDTNKKQNISIKINTNQALIGNKIIITFLEVYKGNKFNDTCISELNFFGKNFIKLNTSNDKKNIFDINNIKKTFLELQKFNFIKKGTPLYDLELFFKDNDVYIKYFSSGDPIIMYHYKYSIFDDNILKLYPIELIKDPDNFSKEIKSLKFNREPVDISKDPLDTLSLKIKKFDDKELILEIINNDEALNKIIGDIVFIRLSGSSEFTKESRMKSIYEEYSKSLIIFKAIKK